MKSATLLASPWPWSSWMSERGAYDLRDQIAVLRHLGLHVFDFAAEAFQFLKYLRVFHLAVCFLGQAGSHNLAELEIDFLERRRLRVGLEHREFQLGNAAFLYFQGLFKLGREVAVLHAAVDMWLEQLVDELAHARLEVEPVELAAVS